MASTRQIVLGLVVVCLLATGEWFVVGISGKQQLRQMLSGVAAPLPWL